MTFDLGVAFDGDGDRVLAVDAEGNVVDGDGVLAVLALSLGVELVAVTSMTNLGFHRLMSDHGIRVVTTEVGDRYVLEALHAEGGVLGGEQSGHVLYLDGHVAGDGLVAAILLSRAVAESGQPLAELVAPLVRFPQAKRDVRVTRKELSPRPAGSGEAGERRSQAMAGSSSGLREPSRSSACSWRRKTSPTRKSSVIPSRPS